ncbi:MAG: tetratricopeptide repeat protein [Acidobacteria bacterium]|nr:tetratricopeptide repeat protein [Acidobacteriota bacterium]
MLTRGPINHLNRRSKGPRQWWLSLVLILISLAGCSRVGLIEQAQTAWDGGDYAAAADLYETFLRENPTDDNAPTIRYRVATVCSRDLRQYDRAIEHLIRLIEDHPTFPEIRDARLRLAECYAATGKRDEAISEYESLLPLVLDDKERRRLRLNVAELYYEQDDLRQSVVEYQKVVATGAYDQLAEKAHLRIGQVRYLRDEFDEALLAYQVVIDNSGDPTVKRLAWLGKIDCLERSLRFDLAIRTVEEMDPDPKSPDFKAKRIEQIRDKQRQRNLIPTAKVGW